MALSCFSESELKLMGTESELIKASFFIKHDTPSGEITEYLQTLTTYLQQKQYMSPQHMLIRHVYALSYDIERFYDNHEITEALLYITKVRNEESAAFYSENEEPCLP